MPEDGQAWRRTLAQLEQDAQSRTGRLAAAPAQCPGRVLQGVQDHRRRRRQWHGLPAQQVWSLWTRYACTAFYSHPWAWNEIGFGGPAYPRGYKNIGLDSRERWERADHDDTDPIPFADRIEKAHACESHLLDPTQEAR